MYILLRTLLNLGKRTFFIEHWRLGKDGRGEDRKSQKKREREKFK
jgi:hypothetical protein